MAHIPLGDIEQIWKETPDHNWPALRRTLEGHVDQAHGIANELVLVMIKMTNHFEQTHQPYPSSEHRLYDLFNQRLPAAEQNR